MQPSVESCEASHYLTRRGSSQIARRSGLACQDSDVERSPDPGQVGVAGLVAGERPRANLGAAGHAQPEEHDQGQYRPRPKSHWPEEVEQHSL